MSEGNPPIQVKRPGRPPKSQPATAPGPDMAPVESLDIEKAQDAIRDYKAAQKPEDAEEGATMEPAASQHGKVKYQLPNGRVYEDGFVEEDQIVPQKLPEQIVINRTEAVTDEQWADLKGLLTDAGVKFQAGMPR